MSVRETFNRWIQICAAEWYYFWGKMYRYMGNRYGLPWHYEKAVDYFTQALQQNPSLAQVYMERGILYWRELDHPRRAIIDLTAAYTLSPYLIEARFNRAIAHQQLREYEQAADDFRAYLTVGDHPHWREYAERMLEELSEWTVGSHPAE